MLLFCFLAYCFVSLSSLSAFVLPSTYSYSFFVLFSSRFVRECQCMHFFSSLLLFLYRLSCLTVILFS
uniref:Uncharacterized protein n=1 Tax=Psorophora albipes TaxID=869069 RepID=T1DG47_9DIPT